MSTPSIGLTSGVLGGISSVGGPPLFIYYINMSLEKYAYIATIQMMFLSGTLFSMTLLATSGYYTVNVLLYSLFASIGILVGSQLGLHLFKVMQRRTLVRVVNMVIISMGVFLIIRSVF
jgi:hypothetical protein